MNKSNFTQKNRVIWIFHPPSSIPLIWTKKFFRNFIWMMLATNSVLQLLILLTNDCPSLILSLKNLHNYPNLKSRAKTWCKLIPLKSLIKFLHPNRSSKKKKLWYHLKVTIKFKFKMIILSSLAPSSRKNLGKKMKKILLFNM
jgi:hypothetical protein